MICKGAAFYCAISKQKVKSMIENLERIKRYRWMKKRVLNSARGWWSRRRLKTYFHLCSFDEHSDRFKESIKWLKGPANFIFGKIKLLKCTYTPLRIVCKLIMHQCANACTEVGIYQPVIEIAAMKEKRKKSLSFPFSFWAQKVLRGSCRRLRGEYMHVQTSENI